MLLASKIKDNNNLRREKDTIPTQSCEKIVDDNCRQN